MRRSAAIYVRVSSQQQVSNFSLEVQEEACRYYCRRDGWLVARVFRVDGSEVALRNETAQHVRVRHQK